MSTAPDATRARRRQLAGSLAAAVLIVAGVVWWVDARLPAVQQRSPELHEAERDRERDQDRATRDAERERERAAEDAGD